MRHSFIVCLLLALLLAIVSSSSQAEQTDGNGFQPLFDGKTLEGWQKRGGQASYMPKDGAIVGASAPNTPNTFLCTTKEYGDFILTYEFKCDAQLNSGVQIRSHVFDKPTVYDPDGQRKTIPAGRVHGYQVEIDPNKPDRLWVGGIYDEGRRGWLFPGLNGGDESEFSKLGKAAYRPDQWNAIRVECRGSRIRTWLNGQPRADFTDDADGRGFIGLQVHGVGAETKPLQVRWKNLRIKEL